MNNEFGLNAVKRVMDVSRETAERLTIYHDLLVHWQKNINLIAPSTIGEIWQRHIADSLVCCKAIGDANHIVDIGSGAGFPGLIQAVLLAETGTGAVHLVESNGKKCSFMNAVIRKTELRNAGVDVRVHNDRVEAVLPGLERPAVISARALASLDNLGTVGKVAGDGFLTKLRTQRWMTISGRGQPLKGLGPINTSVTVSFRFTAITRPS